MRSLKVLVLEDSPFQLMVVHQTLNACGVFDVLTAESVPAAIQSLENRGAVDIAICDLHMEGRDGLDLIQHLAAHQLAKALVICSSAESDTIALAIHTAREQGLPVLGALPKPATANAVHELLADYQASAAGDPRLPLAQVDEISQFDGSIPAPLREMCDVWCRKSQP